MQDDRSKSFQFASFVLAGFVLTALRPIFLRKKPVGSRAPIIPILTKKHVAAVAVRTDPVLSGPLCG